MKRLVTAVGMAWVLALSSGVRAVDDSPADDPAIDSTPDYATGYYDDSMTHPLRVAYYFAHPIGYALEWAIARPFIYLISRPSTEKVFGYQPETDDARYYRMQARQYDRGD